MIQHPKNIVRYMTVGQPVLIGAKPEEPEPEPESEELDENQEEEFGPEPGIPPEILEKVYEEIDEIERKSLLLEKKLQDADETQAQADAIKAQAEEIKRQAEELKAEAEQIIEDTKKEAEELLERVHKEGYDAGYEEGKEDGIKDGREHIEEELADIVRQANDKAQKTIQDAKEQTAEYFIRAEDEIVAVVMMAIEKILPQHFLDVPQTVLPLVREAISYVRDQKEIKVHVDPDSYDLVLMARSEFQSMLTDGTALIEVVSDEALKPGDCVIETPNGGVDARLSTQLDLLKTAVKSVLNN
ncbi:MAG: flagellar assembly protein FliH [Selenomonadaceae bacterium]|nr:flagellar assembly protein FliH [Selenomonadaceae bacterium]